MHRRLHESAFAAISVLLSLLISALVSGVVLHSLHTSGRLLLRTNQLASDAQIEARVVSLLDQMMQGLDQHPLPIFPQIHRGPLKHVRYKKPGSDAITYLNFKALNLYRVKSWTSSQAFWEVEFCPAETVSTPNTTRSFLALSASGFLELTTAKRTTLSRNKCRKINIHRPKTSLITGAVQELDPRFATLLIPIESIYTFYVDTTNTLRILQYSGDEVLEHQPVVEGIQNLKLHARIPAGAGLYSVALQLETSRRTLVLNFTHHIARSRYRDYLFWINRHAKI